MRSEHGVSSTEMRAGRDNAVLIERGNASAITETHQWRRICDPGATGRDRSNGASRCPAVI